MPFNSTRGDHSGHPTLNSLYELSMPFENVTPRLSEVADLAHRAFHANQRVEFATCSQSSGTSISFPKADFAGRYLGSPGFCSNGLAKRKSKAKFWNQESRKDRFGKIKTPWKFANINQTIIKLQHYRPYPRCTRRPHGEQRSQKALRSPWTPLYLERTRLRHRHGRGAGSQPSQISQLPAVWTHEWTQAQEKTNREIFPHQSTILSSLAVSVYDKSSSNELLKLFNGLFIHYFYIINFYNKAYNLTLKKCENRVFNFLEGTVHLTSVYCHRNTLKTAQEY